MNDIFRQDGYRLRLEWGSDGLAALASRCVVLVVVDVLSFTTSVDIAVGRGGRVLPVRREDTRAIESARDAGAVIADEQQWSLRPASLVALRAHTLLALPSPNGAAMLLDADQTGSSSEVRLAASTFTHALDRVRQLLANCTSGRELIAQGHRADIELAAAVESSSCAPVLRDGVFTDGLPA